jgi:hypothetical protein
MQTFTIKRNNTFPALEATLSDENGPIDLTGASVHFQMEDPDSRDVVLDRPVAVVDAEAGQVRYDWRAEDTERAGQFDAEFEITWPDGAVASVPNGENIRVIIKPDVV